VDAPEREPAVPREELQVAVHARQELSPEHEPEIVEAFLERVGGAIDARVDERVAEHADDDDDVDFAPGAIGVAIGSIALGIPVTAVAGSNGLVFAAVSGGVASGLASNVAAAGLASGVSAGAVSSDIRLTGRGRGSGISSSAAGRSAFGTNMTNLP